ncbi:hypothetical protein [Streptomyces bungoensis]|uniref:hypothetical protein n=1 Tax=Streptomyces bungoensis TaxID=285568 RepID=UPI000AF2C5E0|nr:hypothetical protein [Streptomyces bungoensis]
MNRVAAGAIPSPVTGIRADHPAVAGTFTRPALRGTDRRAARHTAVAAAAPETT